MHFHPHKTRQMQQFAKGSTARTSPWSTSRPSRSLHGISVLKFRKMCFTKKHCGQERTSMNSHASWWTMWFLRYFVNLGVNSRWFWVVSVWYVFHFPATSPADVYRQFLRRCWDVVRNSETSSVHLRLRRQVRITFFPGWYQLIWYLRNSSYIFRIFPDRISNYSNCI